MRRLGARTYVPRVGWRAQPLVSRCLADNYKIAWRRLARRTLGSAGAEDVDRGAGVAPACDRHRLCSGVGPALWAAMPLATVPRGERGIPAGSALLLARCPDGGVSHLLVRVSARTGRAVR